MRWIAPPLAALVSILLAGTVLASLWLPELSHWYVQSVTINDAKIQWFRKAPEQHLVDEIAEMRLISKTIDSDQILPAAEQLMRGTLNLAGFSATQISLPFAPEDLERGPSVGQLQFASLALPDILLDAYKMSKRDEFFRLARDIIVAFAQYESTRLVNHGFLWNDHAVGARIPVLIKFWAEYRARSDFEVEVGRIVLNLVVRSAQLLAKPAFYAPRTDHGIIADLAMLQIAAAFPGLPNGVDPRSVAINRFREHLRYYIADEGVTLLHSAGYHSIGVNFFGMALRLFTLNRTHIPLSWWENYSKAIDFYSLLRRPDGTLPMIGDTLSTPEKSGHLVTERDPTTGVAMRLQERNVWPRSLAFAVYPVAGHSIWWDSSPQTVGVASSQTAITWSHHPGFGHVNAHEPSMIVWARGRTWLTNAGYWPYGMSGREQAESWEASNAPHLFGESKNSQRSSRVRGLGQGPHISFIDIERRGPKGYSVRRQIAKLRGVDTWVVLDQSQDSAERTTTTNWTFYPDLVVTPHFVQGGYRVSSQDSRSVLWCWISGSAGVWTEPVIGRKTPFAGWIALGTGPVRAPAIVLRMPSREAWSLAVFSLSSAGTDISLARIPSMRKWLDGNHWALAIPTPSGELSLTREGDRLRVHRQGSPNVDSSIALAGLDAPASEVDAVRNAFRLAVEKYPKFREHIGYRIKVSCYLLAVLGVQELLFFLIGLRAPIASGRLRVVSWAMWVSGGIWLYYVYFWTT